MTVQRISALSLSSIGLLGGVLLGACVRTDTAAVQRPMALDDLHARAAFELGCPQETVQLQRVSTTSMGASGCERRIVYRKDCSAAGCVWNTAGPVLRDPAPASVARAAIIPAPAVAAREVLAAPPPAAAEVQTRAAPAPAPAPGGDTEPDGAVESSDSDQPSEVSTDPCDGLLSDATIGVCADRNGTVEVDVPAQQSSQSAPTAPPESPPAGVAVVARPVRPGPAHLWVDGYWYWSASRFVWIPGYWVPPRRGYVYVTGRWRPRGRSWVYTPGGWGRPGVQLVVAPLRPRVARRVRVRVGPRRVKARSARARRARGRSSVRVKGKVRVKVTP